MKKYLFRREGNKIVINYELRTLSDTLLHKRVLIQDTLTYGESDGTKKL